MRKATEQDGLYDRHNALMTDMLLRGENAQLREQLGQGVQEVSVVSPPDKFRHRSFTEWPSRFYRLVLVVPHYIKHALLKSFWRHQETSGQKCPESNTVGPQEPAS